MRDANPAVFARKVTSAIAMSPGRFRWI